MNLKRELEICKEHEEKGYRYWGICKYCVPRMLRKLRTGEIEHDKEKLEEFRKVTEGGK